MENRKRPAAALAGLALLLGLTAGLLLPGALKKREELPRGGLPEDPAAEGRVDLNRADAAQLDELPGIGKTLAGAIVDYRRANGPFESVWELTAVPGISEHRVWELYRLVKVTEKE